MTIVTRQIHFAIKGRRKRALDGPAPDHTAPTGRIPRVAKLMALAIRFEGLLEDGVVANQSELARLARVTQPRMTQIMNLLHLAPDIQEELLFSPPIVVGTDPLSERHVRRIVSLVAWNDQRSAWCDLRRSHRIRPRRTCGTQTSPAWGGSNSTKSAPEFGTADTNLKVPLAYITLAPMFPYSKYTSMQIE